MARDLGTKYVCYKCGTKSTNLKKPVPACPKCGAEPTRGTSREGHFRPRRARGSAQGGGRGGGPRHRGRRGGDGKRRTTKRIRTDLLTHRRMITLRRSP